MQLPNLDREKKYWSENVKVVVGIDEAGRGPLAGPVVAGAVVVMPSAAQKAQKIPEFTLIRDSKALSARQREIAYGLIVQNFHWGVGFSDEKTIDRVNILQAAFLAMKKAISDVRRKLGSDAEVILIDGRSPIPNFSTKQESIVGGDKFVFSISAASIVAKVTRDRIMIAQHEKFPEYGFAKHKGYGTKFHYDMLEKHGSCEAHRKSFRLKRKKT